MSVDSQTPEEVVRAAKAAQRALEEQKATGLAIKLKDRQSLIGKAKEAGNRLKGAEGQTRDMEEKIEVLKKDGKEVSPAMVTAAKTLRGERMDARAEVEEHKAGIGEIEKDQDVVGALRDEAKKQDKVEEEKARLKKDYEETLEEIEAMADDIEKAGREIAELFRKDNGKNVRLWVGDSIKETVSEAMQKKLEEEDKRIGALKDRKQEEILRVQDTFFKRGLGKLKDERALLVAEGDKILKKEQKVLGEREKVNKEWNELYKKMESGIREIFGKIADAHKKKRDLEKQGGRTDKEPVNIAKRFSYAKLERKGNFIEVNLSTLEMLKAYGYDREKEMNGWQVTEEDIATGLEELGE